MLPIFDSLREPNLISIALRIFLAIICGGIIGIEREFKRRPAGFRTHILICMGAAITTLTSQYLYLYMNYYTDMARLGAQVIAGIGFIGAGTIIVTRRKRVKGLTTAAGLWTSAIVGLALGMGFYEAGILASLLIFVAETIFSKLEDTLINKSREINLFTEYTNKSCLENMLRIYKDSSVKVLNMEITRSPESDNPNACAIFSLRLSNQITSEELIEKLNLIDGVISIEEL